MPSLTAAIIVFNEENNLPHWLKSISSAVDEIVAVDSGSTDRTVEILRDAHARVEFRAWSNYAEQRNFCASLCKTDWVLFLDADEFPDATFSNDIKRLRDCSKITADAFRVCRKVFFYDHWLKHGGWFPEYRLRCYRFGRGHWETRAVHEKLICQGPIDNLAGYVHHHSWRGVGDYISRCQRYGEEAAGQMFREGKKSNLFKILTRPSWTFLHRYVLRLGFLDGYPGYLAARLESLYTLSKYAHLLEIIKDYESRSPIKKIGL